MNTDPTAHTGLIRPAMSLLVDRVLGLAAIGLIAVAAVPAAAEASTAYVTDDGSEQVIHYDSAPGEKNQLTVYGWDGGGGYSFEEYGYAPIHITPGANCLAVNGDEESWVACPVAGLDRVEISLGDGEDVLQFDGGSTPTVVLGGPGADQFHGGARGSVRLDGGDGSDTFHGGSADHPDEFVGGGGEDHLYYWSRYDPLDISVDEMANDGYPGEQDNVHSDIENLLGGWGNDTITGSDGPDHLHGYFGQDDVDGGAGNDVVNGGNGTCLPDEVAGGEGDDTLHLSGAGSADGGGGDDRLIPNSAACPNGVANDISGGSGLDTADFAGATSGSLVTVSLDDVANDAPGGSDNVHTDIESLVAGGRGMTFIGGSGPDQLVGGWGDDELRGGGGADVLLGNGGADKLLGGDGEDEADGGASSDNLIGGAQADTLDGGAGKDTADYSDRGEDEPVDLSLNGLDDDGVAGEGDGLSGLEVLLGGAGDDRLSGDDDDNTLDGGPGEDLLSGHGGNDELQPGQSCDEGELNGGDGSDTLHPSGASVVYGGAGDDVVRGNLRCEDGADDVFGGPDTDTADFSWLQFGEPSGFPPMLLSLDDVADDGFWGGDNYHMDVENAVGNSVGSVLIGSSGPNVLTGGYGDDLLQGGGGGDTLIGDVGFDLADYSDHDVPVDLSLNDAPDDGAAGEGDNLIGIEDLLGGNGADTLTGDWSDNILDGGPGADLISGGDGYDAADYSVRDAAVSVTLDDLANDGNSADGAVGARDNVTTDVEDVLGGAGDDTLIGSSTENILFGSSGNDFVIGAEGEDLLVAGDGDDAVMSRDSFPDEVDCGEGIDTAATDPVVDFVESCETLEGPRAPVLPAPDTAGPEVGLRFVRRESVKSLLRRGLRFGVRCSEACEVRAHLFLSRRTARTLGLASRRSRVQIGTGTARLTQAGSASLVVRLNRRARRGLRAARRITLSLRGTARDLLGNTTRFGRRLTVTRRKRLPARPLRPAEQRSAARRLRAYTSRREALDVFEAVRAGRFGPP